MTSFDVINNTGWPA